MIKIDQEEREKKLQKEEEEKLKKEQKEKKSKEDQSLYIENSVHYKIL